MRKRKVGELPTPREYSQSAQDFKHNLSNFHDDITATPRLKHDEPAASDKHRAHATKERDPVIKHPSNITKECSTVTE
jgi:hypothetical protein